MLAVHTTADLLFFFIAIDSKYYGWYVVVPPEGVEQLELSLLRPDDLCS